MPISVLLVDDHAIVREGLRALLRARGDLVVVGEAGDGEDAVAAVEQLAPDVVVMDISMPRLNGIDATAEIRRRFPRTHVVMLSVHATSEHVFRALQAGAEGYVLKESVGQEVVDAIRTVAAGRRYLSTRIADAVNPGLAYGGGRLPARSPLDSLSQREREVLQLVVESWSSAEIGGRLKVSPKTVETYRGRIMAKLGIHDLPGLVRFAIKHGMTHE
jgi:DNA-binding NarL/FixJ family response regulator